MKNVVEIIVVVIALYCTRKMPDALLGTIRKISIKKVDEGIEVYLRFKNISLGPQTN
jgi:hypothetical protein